MIGGRACLGVCGCVCMWCVHNSGNMFTTMSTTFPIFRIWNIISHGHVGMTCRLSFFKIIFYFFWKNNRRWIPVNSILVRNHSSTLSMQRLVPERNYVIFHILDYAQWNLARHWLSVYSYLRGIQFPTFSPFLCFYMNSWSIGLDSLIHAHQNHSDLLANKTIVSCFKRGKVWLKFHFCSGAGAWGLLQIVLLALCLVCYKLSNITPTHW